MGRISIVSVLATLLLAGCVTESSNGDSTAHTAVQNKGAAEYLCEGLCTYKTAKGSIQRIALTFHNPDEQLAWKGLKELCLEIQGIGVSQNNKKASEPLIVSETTIASGTKEYGFRLATKERDCKERVVTPASK